MIRFLLNGSPAEIPDEENRTLLEYLRNIKCMKGTKEACGTGHCGACSVLVDGKLARACVTMLKRLEGRAVETIENARTDAMLQVIQRAFLDVGAVQCGFCTPGMVIATKALLLKHPSPSEEEIYEGLKNNYCRCTGYVKIIEAIKLSAARLRGEDPGIDDFRTRESSVIVVGKDQAIPQVEGSALGKSIWDVDGLAKTGGTLKFCDDLGPEEFGEDTMLHGAFVWAPVPHAKIRSVDYSAVEQAEGVVRVVTWKDVPGLNKMGNWTPEQPVFCKDEVQFLGDHLALVVADTQAHARAAAKLANIDYEALPGIYSMADGYRKNSFIVHTGRVSGDVEAAKHAPGIVKIKVSKEIEPQEHACMEPISAIGYVQGDHITVYACTQAPFEVRAVYEACIKLKADLESCPWQPGEERRAEYYFACDPCFPIGDFEGAAAKGVKYRNFPAYAYATQAAIVEVEKSTGHTKVLKFIAAHDVGRAINPHIIEGQMHGSCSMGQGYALTEGFPTKDGYPVKKTYRELGLPRAEDTPDYELILIEDPEPQGPYGAKGISEVATVPATPAILNAVSNAIGVRINKVPASPEVVLEAIRTGRCDVPTMDEMIAQLNTQD